MSMDISTIETKVDEEILLKCEELLDLNNPAQLKELSNGRWESLIIDNSLHFNPVVQIASQRLKHFKCNCNTIQDSEICSHILASVLEIRKRIFEKDNRKPKRIGKSLRKRRDISNLLNKVPEGQLREFVISRARKDSAFKLILQGRFLEHLPANELEDYIESIFPPLTKANEKISHKKLTTYLEVSQELESHFKNLMIKDDYIEAFHLAYFHLKKSFYIKHHLQNPNTRFKSLHSNLIDNFLELYNLIEAPEYRVFVRNQLTELLSSSYISASFDKEREIWLLLLFSVEDRANLLKLAENYLSKRGKQDYDTYYFINMLTTICAHDEEVKKEAVKLKDAQKAYREIHLLIEYKRLEKCNEILLYYYNFQSLNQPLALLITKHLIVPDNFVDETAKSTIAYYLKYRNTKFVEFLDRIAGGLIEYREELIEKTRELSDNALFIDLLFIMKQYSDGKSEISKNLSFEVLKKFDIQLFQVYPETCFRFYWQLIDQYLSDHFGRHAIEFIEETVRHTENLDSVKWNRWLIQQIRSKYPDRKFRFY